MNLRTKFQLASFLLIQTVVIGMMVTLYNTEKNQIWSDLQREQLADLKKLASVYEQTMIFNQDEITMYNYAKSLTISPLVAYVGYFDQYGNGFTKYASKPNLFPTEPADPAIQEIIAGGKLLRRNVVMEGLRFVELAMPVKSNGFVRLGYSEDVVNAQFQEGVKIKFRRFLMVGAVAVLVGLVLATLMGTALSKPIHLLMKAAEEIAKGNKDIRLPVRSQDEVGRLTKTFNTMSDELSKLDQLKDDFMSHVTHELRSPLTSIIATVELMAENPLVVKDPKLKRSVDRLNYGSERLNRLVDNILDLMRMKAGKMQFDIQPVTLPILLAEMADFFSPRAQEKGLEIRSEAPRNFPLVMADPEKIRQVLSNLIYNAIKFTNKGGITLWARLKGDMAEVGVQDTGVGIPKDQLGRIFGKFETLQDTKNRVDKPMPGSGLGLNIVMNSITAQGGTVRVESEVDKGSIFIFTLPIAPADIQKRFSVQPESLPPVPGNLIAGTRPAVIMDKEKAG